MRGSLRQARGPLGGVNIGPSQVNTGISQAMAWLPSPIQDLLKPNNALACHLRTSQVSKGHSHVSTGPFRSTKDPLMATQSPVREAQDPLWPTECPLGQKKGPLRSKDGPLSANTWLVRPKKGHPRRRSRQALHRARAFGASEAGGAPK